MVPFRSRGSRIFLYLALLGALIFYGKQFHPNVTLKMCLEQPERYDETVIEVGNEAMVEHVYADSFTIRYLDHTVVVRGIHPDVKAGEFVLLRARFHKEGWLTPLEIRIAEQRRYKIWVSVLPVLLIGFYFFRKFRFNPKTFFFEER